MRLCPSVRGLVRPFVRCFSKIANWAKFKGIQLNSTKFNKIKQNSRLFPTVGRVTALFRSPSSSIVGSAWSRNNGSYLLVLMLWHFSYNFLKPPSILTKRKMFIDHKSFIYVDWILEIIYSSSIFCLSLPPHCFHRVKWQDVVISIVILFVLNNATYRLTFIICPMPNVFVELSITGECLSNYSRSFTRPLFLVL